MKKESEKLKELMEFIEECKSNDDLTLESMLAARFLALLEESGTDALIILDKKGKKMDILASNISEKAIVISLTDIILSCPDLFEQALDLVAMIQADEMEWAGNDITIH